MKKFLIIALLCIIVNKIVAQPPQTMSKHVPVAIQQNNPQVPMQQSGMQPNIVVKVNSLVSQSVKLNGGFNRRLGGISRTVIPIQIPPHTVELHYSFTAKKDGESVQNLQLAIQLASIVSNVSPMAKIFTGITQGALNKVNTPNGSIGINVYLLDVNNATLFQNRSPQIQYVPGGSVTASSQGLITVKNLLEGTYYLGIENYNFGSGVQVAIEAVAIQSFVIHAAPNRN